MITMDSSHTTNEDLAKMLCNLAQSQRPASAAVPLHHQRKDSDSSSSSSPSPSAPNESFGFSTQSAAAPVAPTNLHSMAAAPAVAPPPMPPAATPVTSYSTVDDQARRISNTSSQQQQQSAAVQASPALQAQPQQQHAPSFPMNQQQQVAAANLAANVLTSSASASLPSFPVKLYEMMQDSVKDNFEDVVSWQPALPSNTPGSSANSVTAATLTPTSSSFKVHHTDRFVHEVMPKYFKQTKFKSFQRQLNIYGFSRIHDGPNRGGYMHPYFQQGAPELLKLIPRKRAPEQQYVASRGNQHPTSQSQQQQQQQPSNPMQSLLQAVANNNNNNSPQQPQSQLPNDQLVRLLQTAAAASVSEEDRQRVVQQNLLLLNAAQQLPPATLATAAAALGAAAAAASVPAPAPPPPPAAAAALPDPSLVDPTKAAKDLNTDPKNQHVFPWKLYKMLEEAELPGSFAHIVSWVQDGKSFKVHHPKDFVAVVMPQYFDQTKYESFRRQLNLYGFTRVVRGQHRGVYSHPLFQRGHKEWCRFISRNQPSQYLAKKDRNVNDGPVFTLPPILNGKDDAAAVNGTIGDPPTSSPNHNHHHDAVVDEQQQGVSSPTIAPTGVSAPATAPAPANVSNETGV